MFINASHTSKLMCHPYPKNTKNKTQKNPKEKILPIMASGKLKSNNADRIRPITIANTANPIFSSITTPLAFLKTSLLIKTTRERHRRLTQFYCTKTASQL